VEVPVRKRGEFVNRQFNAVNKYNLQLRNHLADGRQFQLTSVKDHTDLKSAFNAW